MLKKIVTSLLCLALFLSFSACGQPKAAEDSDGKLRVSVSFDAIKELALAVGGERIRLSVIVPDGAAPHDFEPKAKDLVALSEADVFIYNGLDMEHWAGEAISAAKNEDLIVVETSRAVEPITDGSGATDPHVWLSLKAAVLQAEAIKNAFVQADSEGKAEYEQNLVAFTTEAEVLFSQYAEKAESLKSRSFVTGHAAFGYLCRDFGLEQNSVSSMFAEGEPNPKQLAELVEYCREHQVSTIFAEELASPAVSETLARELGARVETLYTMESAQEDLSYLERMSRNLERIFAALS